MIDKVKQPPKDATLTEPKIGTDGATASGAPLLPESPIELSQKAWDESERKERWDSTPGGRLAIRAFSRGVLGAMFYTAGGLWTKKLMRGYDPSAALGEQKNVMQGVAKIIDECVGKPIAFTVKSMGGDPLSAVHFRPTKFATKYPDIGKVAGRTLGEETAFVTWDFYFMSIGDAIGRDIVGWFDPAIKKDWMDEKGNIKLPEAANAMLKSLWSYTTYYGGEDWAVAIPYVYYMKAQRAALERASPGFRYNFDTGSNNSLKIRNDRVVGSYSLEEILDLQGRFTVYNIGTLMFRELYDKVEHALKGEHVSLYGPSESASPDKHGIVQEIKDAGKWVLRSVIKGVICMTPVIPFLSISRSTQRRHRGMFIDPSENSAVSFIGTDRNPHYFYANDIRYHADGAHQGMPLHYSRFDEQFGGGIHTKVADMPKDVSDRLTYWDEATKRTFDPYARRHNLMENFFSWFGQKQHNVARVFDPVVDAFQSSKTGFPRLAGAVKSLLGVSAGGDLKRFVRPTVEASIDYLPYMYTKKEAALLWDTGKMDMATEGFIDGVLEGDWKKTKRGAAETLDALLHRRFDDPEREREAERRILMDTSAADSQSQDEANATHRQQIREYQHLGLSKEKSGELFDEFSAGMDEVQKKHNIKPKAAASDIASRDNTSQRAADVPWQERVIKGGDGVSLSDSVSTKHSPQTHTGREEMRKLLEEVQPPTNSLH